MRKLRVAMVSTARGWYGGEEQLRLLAQGLRERGHACCVLARKGETFAREMAREGFEVTEFRGRGLSFAGLRTMRRRFVEWQPDVVHFNDSPSLTAGGLASLGLRIPLRVVARRVFFAINFTLPYHRFCERVLCVSSAVAEVSKSVGIPAERLRIVHDGCDALRARSGDRALARQALGIHDDQHLLLTIAGLRSEKGHQYLLEALPGVLQRFPRTMCALAGDGDLGDQLRHQARDLGIESHVRFLGYRHDTPDLIAACDLFVLPSLQEGLCSSLIDVMLAGRPIVTTTAGGIPDLVGGNPPVAWLVPPSDSGTLSATILEALSSPRECTRLRQLAQNCAERLFTADAMVNATLAVYEEALHSRRQASQSQANSRRLQPANGASVREA